MHRIWTTTAGTAMWVVLGPAACRDCGAAVWFAAIDNWATLQPRRWRDRDGRKHVCAA